MQVIQLRAGWITSRRVEIKESLLFSQSQAPVLRLLLGQFLSGEMSKARCRLQFPRRIRWTAHLQVMNCNLETSLARLGSHAERWSNIANYLCSFQSALRVSIAYLEILPKSTQSPWNDWLGNKTKRLLSNTHVKQRIPSKVQTPGLSISPWMPYPVSQMIASFKSQFWSMRLTSRRRRCKRTKWMQSSNECMKQAPHSWERCPCHCAESEIASPYLPFSD